MGQQDPAFASAMALIDAANGEDPNEVVADGRRWPKELLYSERMSDMLARYAPDVCLINRYRPGTRLSLHQDRVD